MKHMAENIENNQEQLDENHLIAIRKEKLRELQEQGKDPFKVTKYNRTHLSQEIKDNYEELEGKDVSVAGRIMAKNNGKSIFLYYSRCKRKNSKVC
jgi:lysyl-tRNA synthetase class 2